MGIVDKREIRFEADAVLASVAAQPRAAALLGLPAAPADDLQFEPHEGRVLFSYKIGAHVEDFAIAGNSLGAILIGFCCINRISLPRNAAKSIQILDDAVILTLLMRPSLLIQPRRALRASGGG